MPRDFEWSKQNYSVRDIIYNLADRLPIIAKVTDGYCSNDYFHDFGAEQTLRIYGIARQERVVVREGGGRYLSIPCSYPDRVRITYGDGRVFNKEASMSAVANVIRKQSCSNFTLLLANDRSLQTANRHSGEDTASDFGVLQPITVYDEPYFLVHTIVNGHLNKKNTFIPAYVGIAMSVAVGVTDGTHEEFEKVLTDFDFDFAAAACRHDCVAGKQEIIVFPQTPCESDYDYIVPVMHVNVARSDDWRTDYDGYLKSVPSLPRTQMAAKDPYVDILTPATLPPPTRPAARRPQTRAPPAPPPIPARVPTAKRSTPVHNTPTATTPTVTFPANSMAAVVAKISKFNVRDDSKRHAVERLPVAAISPQPTVRFVPSHGVSRTPSSSQTTQPTVRLAPSSGVSGTPSSSQTTQLTVRLAPSYGVSKTPSSSQAAYSKSVLPARSAVRPPAVPPARRPSDGLTRALGSVSLTSLAANAVGEQHDDILSRDVHCLSTEEVSVCLTRLKMPEHVDEFADKEVDGEMLSCLDETILIYEFHFSRFNAKKLMKFVTEGYIPRTGSLNSSCVSDV